MKEIFCAIINAFKKANTKTVETIFKADGTYKDDFGHTDQIAKLTVDLSKYSLISYVICDENGVVVNTGVIPTDLIGDNDVSLNVYNADGSDFNNYGILSNMIARSHTCGYKLVGLYGIKL